VAKVLGGPLGGNGGSGRIAVSFQKKARPTTVWQDTRSVISRTLLVPVHPAGKPFIALFAAATVALFFAIESLGWIGVILTLWCICFFRDPDRVTPTRPGLVVSPADGVVQKVDSAPPPPETGLDPAPRPRICVVMSVFDVHVNRSPIDGILERIAYKPGPFLNASRDKASEDNERRAFVVRRRDGRALVFVQIAGLVARRIVLDAREGQEVKTGERVGMIRFGSRVDVYLPEGAAPLACEGQRCVAGETVLADLESDEAPRSGAVRR
jgi:phosphatidylserine decarboxylase